MNKKTRQFSIKRKLIFFLPFLLILLTATTILAAVPGKERTFRLIALDDHVSRQGVFVYLGRQIGWGITCGLKWLAEIFEGMLDASYNLVSFTTNSKISEFLSDTQPIVFSFLTLGILFYAFCKITKDKFTPPLLENIVLFIIILTASGSLFNMGNTFIKEAKAYLTIDGSISDQVVGSGIEDIFTYEYYNYKWSDIVKDKDKITPASNAKKIIKTVDAVENIDGGGGVSSADTNPYTGKECDRQFYDYKLVTKYNADTGKMTYDSVEIKDSAFFEIFYGRYYRYNFNWLAMWLGLIACIVVYLLSTYKVVRISYELVVHRMIAPFVAGGDITNGKKIKQLVMSVFGNYMTLVSILVIQKAYGFFYVWINRYSFVPDSTVNIMFQAVMSVFLAIAVVDAPNIFEQILGVDAGLKSGYSMIAVARGAKAAGSIAAKGIGAVAKGATAGAGMFSGMKASLGNMGNGSGTGSAAPGGESGASSPVSGSSNNTSNDTGTSTKDDTMGAATNTNPEINAASAQETDNANALNKPKEAMTNSGAGADHPNNYYISPNTLGQRYRGSIGDFLKKNTRLGQTYSNAKDFGNAVSNSNARMNASPTVLQGEKGRDGKDGAKGEKGDRGIRGRDNMEKKSSNPSDNT